MLVTGWLSVENLFENSAFVPFEQSFLHRFYDNKIKTSVLFRENVRTFL